MVKTLSVGDQQVPVPGFGAMDLNSAMGTDLDLAQSGPVLLKVIELGCTFWDTAVAYKNGEIEKLLGDFIKKHNVRDEPFGEQNNPESANILQGFIVPSMSDKLEYQSQVAVQEDPGR